MLRATKYIS